MGNSNRFPQRSVLCRTCVNWAGRQSGAERRGSARTCKAGIATHYQVMSCDSYVPMSLARRELPGQDHAR